MKKIFNIICSVLIGTSLLGCYSDDELDKFPVQGMTDISLNVTTSAPFAGEARDIPFTVTIPQTFNSDVDVEVLLSFDGGEVRTSVTVPAGSTSASSNIRIGNDGLNKFSGREVTLSVSGLSVSDPLPSEPSVFNITSNSVSLIAYDNLVGAGFTPAVVNKRMTLLFDWEDPINNDFDMFVFNATTFAQVEDSQSGTRYEQDIFNTEHPDGNYFVAISVFTGSGDVPWRIFFIDPDGTMTTFSGTFTNVMDGDFFFPVINFTKTTVNGVATFTYSQP